MTSGHVYIPNPLYYIAMFGRGLLNCAGFIVTALVVIFGLLWCAVLLLVRPRPIRLVRGRPFPRRDQQEETQPMNGINRRGQKVVCVYALSAVLADGAILSDDPRVPKKDETYTVDDFLPTGHIKGIGDDLPGITLLEVPTPVCEDCDKPLGWPILAFRPLIEDKPSAEAEGLLKLITDAQPLERPKLSPAEMQLGDAMVLAFREHITREIVLVFGGGIR